MYATGEWTGPQDLAEAARWYRLAAENGEAESQYDLGFMLLLGEEAPKSVEEGLMWLERASGQGECGAFKLLADCYERGYCDVPVDAAKALLWRARMEEPERVGFTFMSADNRFSVCYEPSLITPAQLDEEIRAAGLSVAPEEL
jgi:TPR repeat protein